MEPIGWRIGHLLMQGMMRRMLHPVLDGLEAHLRSVGGPA